MIFVLKLVGSFLLWTLYSYLAHALAHRNFKYNFLRYIHLEHHKYDYGDRKWPPLGDFFFWFGSWKGTLDVWLVFTLPLIVLYFFEPEVAIVLLVFHYFYEVFCSKNVLDHNPDIQGKITRFIPIGSFHLKHHKNYKCNYSFYITLWDYLFGTTERQRMEKRQRMRARLNKSSSG
ncbi:sterol desaturase family protein [Thalassomonas viridans]|uniref:Sterol desaturase family protein n=1 Tax=Thalassomonas viridans TaxID=137584 RepID=A0AAE9Z9W7_9GAMM|nr:sterol desaturase family protein [Thalassomonas viridans]WDE09213.1 sterol desaturase family protein [Thalassomonas viridans]